MKTDINKLKYYELLDFCIKHEDIEKKEKNEIIEKLLDYKRYLDYPKYFVEIKWLEGSDRKKFIESINSSNDSQTIYTFSISLKNNLYDDEVYMLFNSLYSFNNDDYTKKFIENYFSQLKPKIEEIIFKICDDKNYSFLIDLYIKYQSNLSNCTKMTGVFKNARALENLYLNNVNINIENLTDYDQLFYHMKSNVNIYVKNITIAEFIYKRLEENSVVANIFYGSEDNWQKYI